MTTLSLDTQVLRGDALGEKLSRACAVQPPPQPLTGIVHKNILIPHMVGGELEYALFGFLGKALEMRGANVVGLLCDSMLSACVCRKVDHYESACTRWCHRNSGPYAAAMGLTHRWYSEFITPGEIEQCHQLAQTVAPDSIAGFVHDGIAIGSLVPQSVESYFRLGNFEPGDTRMAEIARHFLASGLCLIKIAHRVIDAYEIDKIVSDCGMQVEWGVYRLVAAKRGIPVDVINVGLRGSAVKLEIDRPGQPTQRVAGWERWRDLPLTAAQNEALGAYLRKREITPYEFKGEKWRNRVAELDAARRLMGLPVDLDGMVFAMFPNVGFDAGKTKDRPAFDYAADWVVETINWFANHPRHHLIVKVHPGEHHRQARDPLVELIERRCGDVPSNVHVVPPETSVTAQSAVKLADVCLVYTSTVAVEAVGLGKPVVLVGGGRHSGHGVTIDVASRDAYFDLLESIVRENCAPDSPGELGRRYAYAVFFRADIPIQHFRMLDIHVADLLIDSLADLLPERDMCIDALCRGVLLDEPFENPIQPPN